MNSSCDSKKQYPSWTVAARAAKGLHRRTSNRVQPYHCRDGCGFFHAGNVVGPGNLDSRLRRQKLNKIREKEDAR